MLPETPQENNSYSESRLYKSVINNAEEDVKSILSKGIDVQTKVKGPLTCIHIAVDKGHLKIIEHLLQKGADVNSRYPVSENSYTGSTLLYRAAAKGNEAAVSLLLQYNADVKARNRDQSTALHIAAERGHHQIVQMLLSKGAQVNFEEYEDSEGDFYTHQFLECKILRDELKLDALDVSIISSHEGAHSPLHLAVKSGHENIIELLFEAGADVDAINSDGDTALSLAVQRGSSAIFDCILNRSPNVKNPGNKKALRYAVQFKGEKHQTVVEKLTQYGLSYELSDDDYEILIPDDAVKNGHFGIIRKIFGDDTDFGENGDETRRSCVKSLFTESILYGKEEVSKFLLELGASVKESFRLSDVHAVEKLNLDFIKLLLANGLDVSNDEEILVLAVKNNMHELLKVLLENAADVNSTTDDESFLSNYSSYVSLRRNKFPVKEDNISPLLVAAALGDAVSVKILLDYDADIDFETDNGLTPLHFASIGGHLEVVEILLKFGARIEDTDFDGRTSLYLAAEFGHERVVKLLLRCGAEIDCKSKRTLYRTGKSVISIAVEKGHLNVIKTLVEFDNQSLVKENTSKFEDTPLYVAASNGHGSVVKFLLDHGADINSHDDDNETVLFTAARNGHVETVKVLLENGANVRLSNHYDKNTPLYNAVEKDRSDVVPLLLKYGANANVAEYYDSKSPLTIAANKGNLKVVNLLIKSGANVDHCTSSGETALSIALQNGHGEVVKLLRESNAKFSSDEQRSKSLLICAEKGHLDSVTFLLSSGADISFTDYNGRTALHLAARCNHHDIVQVLLQFGADANALDKTMRTPLFLSAEMGHLKVFETLLKSDGNIEAADHLGKTAIYISAENGHGDILNLLMAHGASADVKSQNFKTPLIISAEKDHFEVMMELAKRGSNVNSLDEKGQSALYFAAEHGCADAVTLLLEFGADIDPVAENGMTPLIISAERGHFEILKTLVRNGANVNASDNEGHTALYFVAQYGHVDSMNVLLEHKAAVNTLFEEGKSSLIICSERGYLQCTKSLLKYGANVHAEDEEGLTAVHYAAEFGHHTVVALLLKQCSNIDWNTSRSGVPLLLRCAGIGNYEVADVLMKFGARFDITESFDVTDCFTFPFNNFDLKVLGRVLEYSSSDFKFLSESNFRALFDVVNKSFDFSFTDTEEPSNLERISESFVRFFVKLKAANVYSREANFVATKYSDEDEIKSFKKKCKSEVRRMKRETVGDSDTLVYDILNADLNRLASFARNQLLHPSLRSPEFQTKYPLYSNIIRNQFYKGKVRRQLIDGCVKVCQRPSMHFGPLPSNILESILLYLNNKDLRSLLVSKSHSCGPMQLL